MTTRTARLRQLIRTGCVTMPGAFNGMSARLVEQATFEAAPPRAKQENK